MKMTNYKLGNFATINPNIKLINGNDYPFVAMESIQPETRFINDIPTKKYSGGGTKFKTGDTLFARITPCLENGKIAQFINHKPDVGFGSTEYYIFRGKQNISNSDYLYYLIQTYEIRKHAENSLAGASGRQRADLKYIKKIQISAPELPNQKKTAAILGNFDLLIQNNRKRIQILEEIAQLLYREWFVEFRFPGHEKHKFVNSELGKIPNGWKVVTTGDVAEYKRGKSYRSEDISDNEEGVPFINLKSIQVGGGYRLDGLKWFIGESKDSQRVKRGDIIIAITEVSPAREIIARAGQIPTLPNDYGVFSMDLVKIKPADEKKRQYVYRTLRSYEYAEQVKMYANGANVLHLNPEKILHHPCLLPEESVVEKFCEIDQALFELSDLLILQNQNLQQQKDLLLPKLMSGEIDVSKLDINITKN